MKKKNKAMFLNIQHATCTLLQKGGGSNTLHLDLIELRSFYCYGMVLKCSVFIFLFPLWAVGEESSSSVVTFGKGKITALSVWIQAFVLFLI